MKHQALFSSKDKSKKKKKIKVSSAALLLGCLRVKSSSAQKICVLIFYCPSVIFINLVPVVQA